MPPMMYHVVLSLNRPVKVSVTLSATESDAFKPTINNATPTTSKTPR